MPRKAAVEVTDEPTADYNGMDIDAVFIEGISAKAKKAYMESKGQTREWARDCLTLIQILEKYSQNSDEG